MLQELRAASEVLKFALDRYLVACSALLTTSGSIHPINATHEISNDITRELDSVTSYEEKISRAKTIIIAAKNSSPSVVPISSLPDEIILRIFQLTLGTEFCAFETEVDAGRVPRDSLAVSQVCSRWRRISLGSRYLWSHVDLSLHPSVCKKLLSRGAILASWAGDAPLDIHIIEQLSKSDMSGHGFYSDLVKFFIRFGSRVGSLELNFTLGYFNLNFGGILSSALRRCVPGKLTRFVLKFRPIRQSYSLPRAGPESDHISGDYFFCPNDWERDRDWPLDLKSSELDDLLLPVTVLKLDKVFPYWSSKAYHGLVELRLISWEPAMGSIRITEQQLAGIFQSSPGLKILHFGLEIAWTAIPHPPVELRDLEELHLHVDSTRSQQAFLRLLVPGSKPMQMFLEYEPPEGDRKLPSSPEDELQRFLRRSNIVQLYLDAHHLQLHFPTFLPLLPNLEILILRNLTFDSIDPSSVLPTHDRSYYPKLRAIHFLFGRIQLNGFRWICDPSHLKLQRVTIYRSVVGIEGKVMPDPLDRHLDLLQRICPALEILDDYGDVFEIQDRDKLIRVRYSDY